MAHQTDIPYICQDNILVYLDCFAQYLYREHNGVLPQINILIVGGAALALKHNFRGTVDIDAEISFGGAVSKSIQMVSQSYNIPSDWLNWDFQKSHSYSRYIWQDAIQVTVLRDYLHVYVVSDLSQLCMKLASGRKKDLDDIALLTDRCFTNGLYEPQVRTHFDKLYGGTVNMKPLAVKSMQRRYKALSRRH